MSRTPTASSPASSTIASNPFWSRAGREEAAAMSSLIINAATVPGWGVDADPKNDPTYPYRRREADDHSGQWNRPPLQDSADENPPSTAPGRPPAPVRPP